MQSAGTECSGRVRMHLNRADAAKLFCCPNAENETENKCFGKMKKICIHNLAPVLYAIQFF